MSPEPLVEFSRIAANVGDAACPFSDIISGACTFSMAMGVDLGVLAMLLLLLLFTFSCSIVPVCLCYAVCVSFIAKRNALQYP